jgi:hypothetical protein
VKKFLLFVVAACALTSAWAQQSGAPVSITVDRSEGPDVTVSLGHGVILNRESTLKREWFVVRDAQAPATIEGPAGIRVVFKDGDRGSRGEYQYAGSYRLVVREPITAFEVRAVVIDVFGRTMKTLSSTELVPLTGGRDFRPAWRIFSENEASEAFASVIYVAQVRTAAGRVYVADRAAIFDQVRKVASRLTEADLDPKRDSPSR